MKILTFDIEDWFHILDNKSTKTEQNWMQYESRLQLNMERIFKILEDFNFKATFFCMGWIAKKHPEIIKEIDRRGYEIGSHSNMHQLAYEMTKAEFDEDLKQSIGEIEQIIGKKVNIYRAPGFSITNNNLWAFESLYKNGIEIDCSVFPAQRSHGGLPNFKSGEPCVIDYKGYRLKEFPINVFRFMGKSLIFSGGGYFRIMPYFLVNKLAQNSNYVMTYFHPRDFDNDQPLITELSLFRKFKSYYGLKHSEKKFKRFLENFDFTDLRTYSKAINWEEKEVLYI